MQKFLLKHQILFLFLLLLFLTACGYRFGRGEILERYSTVCVPFVEGDNQGLFTATLIRTLAAKGSVAYRSSGADLALRVSLLPPSDTNIGFMFAPKKKREEISKIVVSNEARLGIGARIMVIDRRTGCPLLGPLEVWSSVDYDFEPDLSNINENAFSLGQLEMHNIAQEAAFFPLYAMLAEKIVDYVNNSW